MDTFDVANKQKHFFTWVNLFKVLKTLEEYTIYWVRETNIVVT